MTDIIHRLRLPWIVAWILGFFVGQWILLQAGWSHAIGSVFVVWRILALIAAYIVLMFLIDRVWKQPSATETRSVAREFVDALILGVFLGLAAAT